MTSMTSKLHESGDQVGWFDKPVCKKKFGCEWVYHWAITPGRREYNCCKIKISTRNSSCKNIIRIVAEAIKQAAWVVVATTRIRAGIYNYWHIKILIIADTCWHTNCKKFSCWNNYDCVRYGYWNNKNGIRYSCWNNKNCIRYSCWNKQEQH